MSVTINFNQTFFFSKDYSITSNEGRLIGQHLLELRADRYELEYSTLREMPYGGVSQNLSSVTNDSFWILDSLLPIDYQLI